MSEMESALVVLAEFWTQRHWLWRRCPLWLIYWRQERKLAEFRRVAGFREDTDE